MKRAFVDFVVDGKNLTRFYIDEIVAVETDVDGCKIWTGCPVAFNIRSPWADVVNAIEKADFDFESRLENELKGLT